MTTTDQRPQRADARRNRDLLLVAAADAFATEGSDAALDDIAKRAGLGIGTLYRHFPTRQDLLEAVFLARMDDLRTEAERLADETPAGALNQWLRFHIELGRKGRNLGSTVMAAKLEEGSTLNTACTAMVAAGQVLLDRTKQAGQVRPEVQLHDLLKMVHGIVLVTEGTPDGEERAERMLELLIGGVRATSAEGA